MLGLPFLTKAKHEAIVRQAQKHALAAQQFAFIAQGHARTWRRIAAENEAAWHTEIANSERMRKQHQADLAIERSVNERLKDELKRLRPERDGSGKSKSRKVPA